MKMETDLSSSSFSNLDQEEVLKSTKAKMGEVCEENERLKKLLVKVVKEYESLEKKVSDMVRSQSSVSDNQRHKIRLEDDKEDNSELVSLSLGNWNSNNKKEIITSDTWSKRRKIEGNLKLGLECKSFETYPTAVVAATSDSTKKTTDVESDSEETKEEENNKVKDNTNSKDEENLHTPQVKKTRVCIRSRCDTPTMNDGCQWRKYGQKIAKGNPCPRAYYRCTVSPSCPVRKQVQRCADDMSILITTYEGTHNHPLPLAATTMASATTAAAAMLKTGSFTSSSQSSIMGPTLTTTSFGLHNSSFISPFMNPNSRVSITNPTMISSSHNSHPTVTLDLTTPNTNIPPFNWLSSSTSKNNSSNFLNFSSSTPSVATSLDFTGKTANASSWGGGYLNYATLYPYNNSYQMPIKSQPTLNETVAAIATKAIATNPNLQSVLAAAISTYVGNKVVSDNIERRKSSSPSSNSGSESSRNLSLFPTLESKNDSTTSVDKKDHFS